MAYSLNWDLDSIYPGGIESPEFAAKMALLKEQTTEYKQKVAAYQPDAPAYANLIELVELGQTIAAGSRTAFLFVNALHAADFTNEAHRPYFSRLETLMVEFKAPSDAFDKLLAAFDDAEFATILDLPALQEVAFALQESREDAKRLLADDAEALLNKLNLDGINAWSSHYDTIASTLSMPFTDEHGVTTTISAGQALNQLDGYPDAKVRAELMKGYEKMWGDADQLTADTLNHLAGARLTEQAAHGYKDYLEKPLALNRMSRETLEAMWGVVDANKGMFKAYFARKAQLLGTDGIGWQDQVAPITEIGDYKPKALTYDDAANFIVENFAKYSPKMSAFAQQAFEKRWIEAEDRPGKAPGGWMESVPDTKESRIFLTFTGSVNDAATIAHELGHAFHTSVLIDLPELRDRYAMNVAETASTFAEMLINDANVQKAESDAEKVVLLDAKMTNPIAMFLNIHARFEFENAFYKERQQGYVPASRLNELMAAAQADAFDGNLTVDHPHFWSSKLHFYIDDVPFYNFPYTFGYLFSTSIYAWAKDQANFEEAYIALLRDTANMSSEDLAKKHLGVDLTQPDFWQKAADLVKADIDEFLTLSAQFVE
ncbi:MAG: M3 family oligoendopeptidase [Lactobacillaceae bacterium]|jgi:pepF/M3 family oligoendopeptidase|nr:M3 family oligoendopeptidase [Lactobacillaceae bacterium]